MMTIVYILIGAFFMLSFTSGVFAQCEPSEKLILKADSEIRYFNSPGYPVIYPSNSKCKWVLEAPNENKRVRIRTVKDVQIEFHRYCKLDYIELFDGPDSTGNGTRRCTTNVTMTSTGRYLTVTFTSDEFANAKGFKFLYTAVDAWEPESTTSWQHYGSTEVTTSGQHNNGAEVTTSGRHNGEAEVTTSRKNNGSCCTLKTENRAAALVGWVIVTLIFVML